MIRASASYTSGWGSFVLLKMDRVRVARGGSLSTLHRRAKCFLFCLPITESVMELDARTKYIMLIEVV